MNGNIDQRLLGHWHDSQRRQRSMREYLAKSALDVGGFEGKTLNLIAEAFTRPLPERAVRSSAATMSAFTADDR